MENRPNEDSVYCGRSNCRSKREIGQDCKDPCGRREHQSLQEFEEVIASAGDKITPLTFLKYVSTNKAQRNVGDEVEKQAQKFANEVWSRNDIYEVFARLEPQPDSLEIEERTLLEKTLEEYRHRGAALEQNLRMEFLEIANNISVLESDFNRVLNEITTKVRCTEEELEGVPPEIYQELEKDGDHYLLPLDYPTSVPVVTYAKNPETRKIMRIALDKRGGKENSERLADALALRDRQAKLLGHENFAQYEIKRKMAKTPDRVYEFMNDLKERLSPLSKKEKEILREMKSIEEGIPLADTVLELWDLFYYHEKLMMEKYTVDQNEVKKYFPMDSVVKGVLEVYQKVLNLEFQEVDKANVWHEDVTEFKVIDKVSGKSMGVFYLDLYPREGKFKHYAVFVILERRWKEQYLLPVTSMVANFQKPTSSQPSLLTHGEVETFFHEFGHLMHVITNNTKYARFGLNGVLPDFIEVPSQMLENWAWKEEILSLLSGHYENREKKLPSDLLKRMIDAKLLDIGTFQLRQVFFSLIDLLYHTKGAEDTTDEYKKLFIEITGFELPEEVRPDAGFGHLMGGYSAGYYSYLWSKVYAQDLYTKFEKHGFMDEKTGLEYREMILAPGGSKDPDEMVREFLGRESNNEAFLKSLGM
ncbi:MAG: Zn-dependent oligopeptidase [Candidatus Thorarchaeota archaeon]|nr:Zn-dependent oligopeptidase [Candidatus Thorarchaeota archaeon]